jgi:hypothetical protein
MLVKLNFNISAWVKELLVEADSEQDAINKVKSMSFAEMIDEGAIVDSETEIQNIDTSIASQDLTIKVSNIEYDFSAEKLDPAVIEYLKARLPKELNVKLGGVAPDDELEELIKEEIYEVTGYDVLAMEYKILETK